MGRELSQIGYNMDDWDPRGSPRTSQCVVQREYPEETRNFCPQPELPDLGWGDDGFGHDWATLAQWPRIQRGSSSYRCFKSHWPSRDFVVPNEKETEASPKFLYVLRTAQAQMISHWHQVWGMGFHYNTTHHSTVAGGEGWNNFVQDWLDGNVDSGSWFDHVAGWYQRWKIEQLDSGDVASSVLLLRYEELKGAPETSIRRVAQFLGLPTVDDESMDRILHLTSYEQMRLTDAQDMGLQFMRWLGVLRTTHIRQGGGEAKTTTTTTQNVLRLSTSQRAALERKYEEKLEPLGIPRDWVLDF